MATERKYTWKPRAENELIGHEIERVDGYVKSSGQAKYTADINTKKTLYAKLLTFKGGAAKIKHLDITAALKVKGVQAIEIIRNVGNELKWDGTPIVAVAAERIEQAADGVRAVKVEYERIEHFVDEANLKGAEAAKRTKNLGKSSIGDVNSALKKAKAVHNGHYGIHTITHMCLEPHGSHCEWVAADKLKAHLSTQNVSGTSGQFAGQLGIDAGNVEIICDYIGGGFGSKFQVDEWGIACAKMAKKTNRPVRLMLDRATELKIAGNRPSGFADVTIAADATGNIIAFESSHWGTSGVNGGTISLNKMPYVFKFENRTRRATGIRTNTGPQRSWRAPNDPQACALSQTAMDDVAAKLGMDCYDLFVKNLDKTPRPEVYAAQMKRAAELIGWKEKWHLRGKGKENGAIKQGLGMALHSWRGRAHPANTLLKVHPNGTVETFGGSQDIGTGTRTVIAITVAETFGLPISGVTVNIGNNKYPRSGPSGGSTTAGGVSGPNRRAALDALWMIFDLVAKKYKVDAATLTAKGGEILSKGKAVCRWKEATALIGKKPLEVEGKGPSKKDGLTSEGVAGVQMADVSVDVETGKIKINKYVCVQDCGLVVDMLTAKSQVYGGMSMCIAYALSEERIMDNKTGRFINADLENYKLPRIGDMGQLIAEMYQPDSEYERGVIGLGEPPVISGGAAISNAVANAIGVRVPVLPMTPKRVLDALKKAKEEAEGTKKK
ncbi:Xanthine dehydrogenase, molybdenum binding subunit [hydrothermal vent metagenome]|uniref:Xanthine dehydrogenase, molybdenum binding subunit n=1 Tax=hydrothermal vent metagenome TaxID=652676 RepID=A0A3B1DJF2_9ZZZZ